MFTSRRKNGVRKTGSSREELAVPFRSEKNNVYGLIDVITIRPSQNQSYDYPLFLGVWPYAQSGGW